MIDMDYDKLINKAIKNNELEQLLCGEKNMKLRSQNLLQMYFQQI